MATFDELVTARKSWIETVLKPWCQTARRADLLKAETEWLDIAGKVPVEKTLWVWAWSRFPELIHENLGIEETTKVQVSLKDGRTFVGFPDARKSQKGQLVVWGGSTELEPPSDVGPLSIDLIEWVRRRSEVA